MTINKKVMTAAVAAALVAPAAAFAQASNVQIYGTFSLSFENRSSPGQDISLAPAAGLPGSSMRGATPLSVPIPVVVGAPAASFASSVAQAYQTAGTPIANQANRTATQGAGSNWGIRGREDLGSGMYAAFQIEVSVAPLGSSPVGATTGGANLATYRNVGLWVGNSTFGEVGFGQWDTPFTMNQYAQGAMHAAYGNASTNMAAGFLGTSPIAPGTISGQSIGQYCGGAGAYSTYGSTPNIVSAAASTCYQMASSFSGRRSNSIWWQSPNWSGFNFRGMVRAQTDEYIPNNGTPGPVTTINELKPTLWGGSAVYENGPLSLRVGYENHKDMLAKALRDLNGTGTTNAAIFVGGQGTTAAQYSTNLTSATGNGITSSSDTAWNLNGRYNFGSFTIGAYWESLRWNASYLAPTAAGGPGNVINLRKTGYRLDGAWQGGPWTLGAQYGKNNNVTGGLDNGNTFDGTSTNANNWIFGLAYSLSKRTNLIGYHTRTNNETNARYSGIVFQGITTPAGADPRYTGLGIRHSF